MNRLGRLTLTLALGALTLTTVALAGPGDKGAAGCGATQNAQTQPAQIAQTQPAAAQFQRVSQTPADVVRAFVDAVNAGNRQAARALFAPNGFAAYGMQGAPKRGAELDGWLQSDIFGVRGRIENPTLTVEGNRVTLRGRYTSTGWSGNANYVFTVEGGRITAWNLL